MGTGKTSWAIQEINKNKDKSYIYITPFLNEVERIKENCTTKFYDPKNFGHGKLSSFNQLLAKGENIVSTHSLFSRITDETKNLIRQARYTLILDEVMDVITPYQDKEDKVGNKIRKNDIKFLLDNNLITIDESNYIIWNEEKLCPETRYEDIMLLSQNKSLVYIDQTVLLWHFPIETFTLFDKAYILTYLFDGQIMKYYFDYHNINYEYQQVNKKDGAYYLNDYRPEDEPREIYHNLINICNEYKLNAIGDKYTALSERWYRSIKESKDKEKLKKFKNNLVNYFTNKTKAKSSSIMWTTFKKYKSNLAGKGYINAISPKEIPPNPTKEDLDKAQCFVPSNCRATNIFADRYNLAYTINKFVNPYITKFFSNRDVQFNEDLYALSEMLQWIWRSRIRNGQPINIYIPSKRMRNLLISWLEKEEPKNEFMRKAS